MRCVSMRLTFEADQPSFSATSSAVSPAWLRSRRSSPASRRRRTTLSEPSDYAGYVPGLLPDNLVSFKATGPLQVTLRLNKPYSTLWFTYNQLAEITPMPAAWDVTSMGAKQGSGGCATDTAADKYARCKAVYAFLAAQAKNTATYV